VTLLLTGIVIGVIGTFVFSTLFMLYLMATTQDQVEKETTEIEVLPLKP
jgi:Na+-transporting methylmalonyl-CoA/oxaloacetate decarboxylase gamma subunit